MIAASLPLLDTAPPGFKILLYVLAGVAALVVLFFLFYLGTCLCERQHLAGDVEPTSEPFPYPATPYWLKTREAAMRLGFHNAGDFATRRSTTLVKGLESLFLSDDNLVMASVVSGSTAGAKLEKTVLRSQLANGRVLDSTDNPTSRDITGVIQSGVLLNAGIEELWDYHLKRTRAAGSPPIPFNRAAALQDKERIDLQRGKRLVQAGYARWADPQQTCIRLNLHGAMAYLTDLLRQMGQLQSQSGRSSIKRAG